MPSGRRGKRRELPPPVFFLDRGLGRFIVADAIRRRGHEVLTMADVYPDGKDERVPDDDWILRANEEDWVALTKDYSIVRDHIQTLSQTRLRVFALNNANLTGPQMAERFDLHLNRILQRSSKPGPYIYVVGSKSVDQRWPSE